MKGSQPYGVKNSPFRGEEDKRGHREEKYSYPLLIGYPRRGWTSSQNGDHHMNKFTPLNRKSPSLQQENENIYLEEAMLWMYKREKEKYKS